MDLFFFSFSSSLIALCSFPVSVPLLAFSHHFFPMWWYVWQVIVIVIITLRFFFLNLLFCNLLWLLSFASLWLLGGGAPSFAYLRLSGQWRFKFLPPLLVIGRNSYFCHSDPHVGQYPWHIPMKDSSKGGFNIASNCWLSLSINSLNCIRYFWLLFLGSSCL